MTPELFIIAKASEAIQALYGVEVPAAQLQVQVTRKEFEGDYTLVVFPLLRVSKTTPENTGNAIGEWLKTNVPEIAGYNTVKGFLNISFSEVYWNGVFAEIAAAEDFGQLPPTGRTIMVEYSSPNTNKPLHLGHIRNNLLGWSVAKLLEVCGNNVMKVNLVNDRGIHICKSMYAWKVLGNGETPESSGKKGDHLVGDYYVAFNNLYKKEVDELVAGGMTKEEAVKAWNRSAEKMVENKWIMDGHHYTCPECGKTIAVVVNESDDEFEFCPFCGKRMSGKMAGNKMEQVAALFGKKLGDEFLVSVPRYDEYGKLRNKVIVKGGFGSRGFQSEQLMFADSYIFAELLEGKAVIVDD